jgi:hypothetical protein
MNTKASNGVPSEVIEGIFSIIYGKGVMTNTQSTECTDAITEYLREHSSKEVAEPVAIRYRFANNPHKWHHNGMNDTIPTNHIELNYLYLEPPSYHQVAASMKKKCAAVCEEWAITAEQHGFSGDAEEFRLLKAHIEAIPTVEESK